MSERSTALIFASQLSLRLSSIASESLYLTEAACVWPFLLRTTAVHSFSPLYLRFGLLKWGHHEINHRVGEKRTFLLLRFLELVVDEDDR